MYMKCAGLIFDDSVHYLDHLAPFCAQMGWPLIICEESVLAQCRRFYPMTTVIHTDFSRLKLPSCIVSCNSKPSITLALGPFASWHGRLIWLPHGWSDKGWKSPFFEALEDEDLLLVYGERMRQVLRAKNVQVPQISIGNFRWQFYQTHHAFYNAILDKHVEKKEFILYAPTWDDSEQNSSFWQSVDSLLKAVPKDRHLLIKVHPNTEKKFPGKLEQLRGQTDKLPNVSFLDDFPPIYPLLDRSQAYIGDMSSIGYDYLRFGRPLFFITKTITNPQQNPSAYLMQCGKQIPLNAVPTIFTRSHQPSGIQPLFYETFDDTQCEITRQKINEWMET